LLCGFNSATISARVASARSGAADRGPGMDLDGRGLRVLRGCPGRQERTTARGPLRNPPESRAIHHRRLHSGRHFISSLDGSRILKLAQPKEDFSGLFSRTDCPGTQWLNILARPPSAGQAEEQAGQTQLAVPLGSDPAALNTTTSFYTQMC
jgi:hypothetical protein